jgi:hypothetical protein
MVWSWLCAERHTRQSLLIFRDADGGGTSRAAGASIFDMLDGNLVVRDRVGAAVELVGVGLAGRGSSDTGNDCDESEKEGKEGIHCCSWLLVECFDWVEECAGVSSLYT